MEYDILLKNASIIDENGDISKEKNILIKDNKIERIVSTNQFKVKEVIDCSNYFITPGFVNLHAHSPMNIFKGIAEDVDIDKWFNQEIWPYESKVLPEDIYYGALLSILEMLDNGVTAFADHYFCADMICKAVEDTGIRADIAPTIFGMADDFEEQLESVSELIKRMNDKSDRLYLRLGPHSPYTCSPEQLKLVIERAKELNVGIHIHVSETEEQVKSSLKKYKMTPYEVLNSVAGFDVPVIIAHGLWIQETDKNIINENVHIAACPKTYMKLGMGYGNIWNYHKELPLAIGTDGAASSNTINPLEQARLFALVGKFIGNDAEDYKLKDIWKMLMKGHDALNFNAGRIAENYDADILIWNLDDLNTMPVFNPLASIIYSSSSKNIIHSIINGKFVKKHGELTIDKIEVIANIKARTKDILKRGKGNTKVVF